MVSTEYEDVVNACKAILTKNMGNAAVPQADWDALSAKIAAATSLTNEAFAGATNCVVSSNIANKEMYDFVMSMSRFVEVYDTNRAMYYDDAGAYYTPHINFLDRQKAVFKQLYDKGNAIINGS